MSNGTQDFLDPERTARAEETVDRFAAAFTGWASRAALEVMRAGARAREEAEDIWAEARSAADSSRNETK